MKKSKLQLSWLQLLRLNQFFWYHTLPVLMLYPQKMRIQMHIIPTYFSLSTLRSTTLSGVRFLRCLTLKNASLKEAFLMRHRGFEPRTTWLKVKCSTNWANIPLCIPSNYLEMPSSGIEPETRGFSVLCSTNWANWAWIAEAGFEPATFGLWARRASRLLHPASIKKVLKWMEVDSNHRSNLQQIYSLSPLATRESIHNLWDL